MKHLRIYEDFKREVNPGYIKAKIRELQDFTRRTLKNKDMEITYKLGKNSLNVLIVLDINDDHKSMDIIMDFETLNLSIYSYDGERGDNIQLNDIEEGMQIIQETIYDILNLSENLIIEDKSDNIADQIIDDLLED